jgi:heme exporter protein A
MLYDDLTLEENLTFAARLHRLPDPAGIARRSLEAMELATRANDQPRTLSRGLLQRAALARALVNQPAVLLLDEPFTGLDAHAAERLRALLTARRPAGLGTIVVTHQVHEAWSLADRVVALVQGRWALEADMRQGAEAFLARYLEVTGD